MGFISGDGREVTVRKGLELRGLDTIFNTAAVLASTKSLLTIHKTSAPHPWPWGAHIPTLLSFLLSIERASIDGGMVCLHAGARPGTTPPGKELAQAHTWAGIACLLFSPIAAVSLPATGHGRSVLAAGSQPETGNRLWGQPAAACVPAVTLRWGF